MLTIPIPQPNGKNPSLCLSFKKPNKVVCDKHYSEKGGVDFSQKLPKQLQMERFPLVFFLLLEYSV